MRSGAFLIKGTREFTRSGYESAAKSFDNRALERDYSGQHCLVTGANQGLGFTTAQALAKLGFTVHMLCRNPDKGKEAVEKVKKESGNKEVVLEVVDVSDMASMQSFASEYNSSGQTLNVIINSAGIMCKDGRKTNDAGLELSFATNTLGAFALTRLLEPVLKKSTPARVIYMSSGGMYTEKLEVDDMEMANGTYDGQSQYAKDKRRMQVYAESFAERWQAAGVNIGSYSMHPGWAETGGARDAMGGLFDKMEGRIRTPEQGADTAVWLACEDVEKLEDGAYYLDRRPAKKHMLASGTEYTDEQRRHLWTKLSSLCKLPE